MIGKKPSQFHLTSYKSLCVTVVYVSAYFFKSHPNEEIVREKDTALGKTDILVIDDDRHVVVGATTVGPHGGEMIAMLALAVHAAIPVSTLRSMIYAYPTFWRGIEDALNQLG